MNEDDSEKITESQVYPEKIEIVSEIIDSNPEQIENDSEKMPEKKRYRGQRGSDKGPRRLNQNSLMNLKPYQTGDLTVIEEKPTTMGINKKVLLGISVFLFLMLMGIIIWKLIKQDREITAGDWTAKS